MEQLLKVTTTRFQAIHFKENARLVPTDSIDVERRKAVARQRAFRARHTGASLSPDMKSVNKINQAFGRGHAVQLPGQSAPSASQQGSPNIKAEVYQNQPPSSSVLSAGSYPAFYQTSGSMSSSLVDSGADSTAMAAAISGALASQAAPAAASTPIFSQLPESQASYNIERGSFEMRVAKGEVSYVPALEMTIITQLPEIHFEYIGGFNYVPPSSDPAFKALNLSI